MIALLDTSGEIRLRWTNSNAFLVNADAEVR